MWTAGRSSDHHYGRGGRAAAAAAAILFLSAAPREEAGAPGRAAPAEALEREIAALEREIDDLGGEEASLARDLEALAAREALARRRSARAAARREAAAAAVRDQEARRDELLRAAEIGRARARSALRELYKQDVSAGYASLLSVSDPSELMTAFQHLGALARRHTEAVALFERRRAEAEDAARRLEATREALDAASREAARESEAAGRERSARLALLQRAQRDREAHLQAVREMTRAASRLAEALRSLPPGGAVPGVTMDFERLKGALPWPAEGAVSLPFGSIRHPRFGTLTPHPGVDIRAAPGAPVRAVGAGRVVFNRRYGSYGRTVVIDHGGRYLSVYARLAAAGVVEGDDIAPGQEIGFSGEADGSGKSSVYFEIRHQGRALDPADWLRRGRPPARPGGGG